MKDNLNESENIKLNIDETNKQNESEKEIDNKSNKVTINQKETLKKGDLGFAMLRCANWGYYIKKLYCIIGYKPIKYDNPSLKPHTTWEVDVDLGHLKNISKQHALIAYNFYKESFEIKNLSKKFPIKVNNVRINYNEEIQLTHKSVISISNQEFYFLLPQ